MMTPAPKRRRLRFSLRTFLIVAALAAIALAVSLKELDSARKRRMLEEKFSNVTPILRDPNAFPFDSPATH
jgi:hypothetical protein